MINDEWTTSEFPGILRHVFRRIRLIHHFHPPLRRHGACRRACSAEGAYTLRMWQRHCCGGKAGEVGSAALAGKFIILHFF